MPEAGYAAGAKPPAGLVQLVPDEPPARELAAGVADCVAACRCVSTTCFGLVKVLVGLSL